LNYQTHKSLGELFGSANMRSLRQFSLMLRRDQIVDAEGRDVYLSHLERLKIPITFIHGAENQLFLPSGSEKTYKLLCEKNGRSLYARYVIPGYAHLDCFIGEYAARDVFPLILEELERGDRVWRSLQTKNRYP
jgi:cholesterol oxidase